nr:VOC family protein [Chloroflexota bacterium]
MGNAQLDMPGILAEAEQEGLTWAGLAPETRIGHIHLHVGDLATAEEFYVGVLGFDVMLRLAGQALFISAGGYHHHIGLNTWAGVGAPPPPPGSAGLRAYEIAVPAAAALDEILVCLDRAGVVYQREATSAALRDPWGNGLVIQTVALEARSGSEARLMVGET